MFCFGMCNDLEYTAAVFIDLMMFATYVGAISKLQDGNLGHLFIHMKFIYNVLMSCV